VLRALPIVLCLMATPALAQSSSFELRGFLTARAVQVSAQPSWTSGGFGRFDVGAETRDDERIVNLAAAHVGFDWNPARWLLIHADGVARKEPEETKGDEAGLVQAYAEFYTEKLRFRAGMFWLPTSRENIDPLWHSRYTLTYSALNSWIGQEIRPIGVDFQYSPTFYVTAGATAFRGNDTMGTLLSSRGWTFGNRLSVYDEALPQPAPAPLSIPIGPDTDGELGWAGRVRFQVPERAMLQVARIDNRAELRSGEPPRDPWRTKLTVVSADIGAGSPTTLAAEWASGSTAVGFTSGSFTLDFRTWYILASQKRGRDRWTTRIDTFTTRDHDQPLDPENREDGRAYTVAWLHDFSEKLRGGLEYVRVTGDRLGAATSGYDVRTGGSTIAVELRYAF
jgi:hypothetical protein